MANNIQGAYALPTNKDPIKQSGQDKSVMGKDDFLKILVAQLANQDPMNPMEDKEFVAQMAQFSSLEQMTNMTSAIESFVDANKNDSLVQHSELIGKEIIWERGTEEEKKVEEVEGVVESVKRDQDGNFRLFLKDGRWINSSQLVQVGAKEK